MRHGLVLAFDEVIAGASIGDLHFYSSPELSSLLAVPDQLGIQVIVDDAKASPGPAPQVAVRVETSGNGIYWATKSAQPEVPPFDITTNATTVSPYGADPGTLPNLGFVRLWITLTVPVAPASAHVKVYVTLRDGGGELVMPVSPSAPSVPPKQGPQGSQGQGGDTDKPENPHIYHGPNQPGA